MIRVSMLIVRAKLRWHSLPSILRRASLSRNSNFHATGAYAILRKIGAEWARWIISLVCVRRPILAAEGYRL